MKNLLLLAILFLLSGNVLHFYYKYNMYFYLGSITSVHALNMRALNIMHEVINSIKFFLNYNVEKVWFCNENNIAYLML